MFVIEINSVTLMTCFYRDWQS